MHKICISNLVYGQPYTDIFLNFHLKSLLENYSQDYFNSPVYLIFTENSNLSIIQNHENFIKIKNKFHIEFITMDGINLSHELRYQLQSLQVEWTTKFALEHKVLLHVATADIFYGKNFFKNAIDHIRSGYDSVVVTPIRAAFESASPYLSGAELSVDELFEVGFNNLHPLWTSSNWESPLFSKLPYNLIWTDDKSICMRGFSLSPCLYLPQEWMLAPGMGCIDIHFLQHFKNCYYCTDWSELPSIELGKLSNFYPPFGHKKANIQDVADWAKIHIIKENISNLSRYTIYKKINSPISEELLFRSKLISDAIMLTARF